MSMTIRSPPSFVLSPSVKILLIRVSSLGDVLHNMPVVDDLRRHFNDAQIDWVVEEGYVNLVRLHPGVRHIIPFALRRWRKSLLSANTQREMKQFYQQVRAEEYDLVIETQGLFKTGIIMGMARLVSGGNKVGLANGTEGSGYEGISRIFHDQSVPVDRHTHAVLRGRLVAAAAGGYVVDSPARFGLLAPEGHPAWLPAHPYAVFFHGTAGATKKWARAHWVAIAAELQQHNLPVLLPWGNAAEKPKQKRWRWTCPMLASCQHCQCRKQRFSLSQPHSLSASIPDSPISLRLMKRRPLRSIARHQNGKQKVTGLTKLSIWVIKAPHQQLMRSLVRSSN